MGLSFLLDSLLESSLDPLESSCSTLYRSLLHLTLSGIFFTRPSLEFPLLDPLLESSCSTLLLESSSHDHLWNLLDPL